MIFAKILLALWRVIFIFFFCIGVLHAIEKSSKLQVSVSIPPLSFFVHEIAGDYADIFVVVPGHKNAETYEPSFKDMQAIAKSRIFIGVGMPFESVWIPKILSANKQQDNMLVVKLHEYLGMSEYVHLWLSIKNAKNIASYIAVIFADYDKENAEFYLQNAQNLIQKLTLLQDKIHTIVQNMPHRDFIVYHPIFDVFAKEYGLNEHSLEQHGKTYGIKEIVALSSFGKSKQIKRVFAEHENRDIRALAQSMNAQVILLNPLAKDYLENLWYIVSAISKSYE